MAEYEERDLPPKDELFASLEKVGLEQYEPKLEEVYEEGGSISHDDLSSIARDLRDKWNMTMEKYAEESGESAEVMSEYEKVKEEHQERKEQEEQEEHEGEHMFSELMEETDELISKSFQVIEGAKQITGGTEQNYQTMAEFFRSMEMPEDETDPYDILQDIEDNAEEFQEAVEDEDDDIISQLAAVTALFAMLIGMPVRA